MEFFNHAWLLRHYDVIGAMIQTILVNCKHGICKNKFYSTFVVFDDLSVKERKRLVVIIDECFEIQCILEMDQEWLLLLQLSRDAKLAGDSIDRICNFRHRN